MGNISCYGEFGSLPFRSEHIEKLSLRISRASHRTTPSPKREAIHLNGTLRIAVEGGAMEARPQIDITIFQQVDMRVGRIIGVEPFPEARKPSYKLTIDFGPLGIKRSSAAIRPWYEPEDLLGRLVVAVVNLPVRRVAGFPSEVLVLGAIQPDGRVILLQPDEPAELGSPIA
jgi:tRNA-binding protein